MTTMGVVLRVVFIALIAVWIEQAHGQSCPGNDCDGCTGSCQWCQAQLNDGTITLNLGVGICVSSSDECADHLEDEAFNNLRELGGFTTMNGPAAFELVEPGDCNSDFGVASIDTNTCDKCITVDAHQWCGIAIHNSLTLKMGGACMGDTAATASCNPTAIDATVFNGYVSLAVPMDVCPSCVDKDNCGECYKETGCQWCAPVTTVSDPTQHNLPIAEESLFGGLGGCSKYNEACPATMGTVGNIFANVPETDFIFKTKVQRAIPVADQCPSTPSSTVWSAYADCATCKGDGQNWCFSALNVTISDSLYSSHGGICMDTTIDTDRCAASGEQTLTNNAGTTADVQGKAAVATSCTDPSGGGSSGASSVEASVFASVVVVGGVMSLFA